MGRAENQSDDPTPANSVSEAKSGIYQHYKEGKHYLVIGVSRHSETGEIDVVYVPLYQHSGPGLSHRPIEMFFEDVEVDGVKQPRFRYLGLGI